MALPSQIILDILASSDDPFNIVANPLLARENFKKIKNITTDDIVEFIIENPQYAKVFFKRNPGAGKLARNFREELCGENGEYLRKLVVAGDQEILESLETSDLVNSSHLSARLRATIQDFIEARKKYPISKLIENTSSILQKGTAEDKALLASFFNYGANRPKAISYIINNPVKIIEIIKLADKEAAKVKPSAVNVAKNIRDTLIGVLSNDDNHRVVIDAIRKIKDDKSRVVLINDLIKINKAVNNKFIVLLAKILVDENLNKVSHDARKAALFDLLKEKPSEKQFQALQAQFARGGVDSKDWIDHLDKLINDAAKDDKSISVLNHVIELLRDKDSSSLQTKLSQHLAKLKPSESIQFINKLITCKASLTGVLGLLVKLLVNKKLAATYVAQLDLSNIMKFSEVEIKTIINSNELSNRVIRELVKKPAALKKILMADGIKDDLRKLFVKMADSPTVEKLVGKSIASLISLQRHIVEFKRFDYHALITAKQLDANSKTKLELSYQGYQAILKDLKNVNSSDLTPSLISSLKEITGCNASDDLHVVLKARIKQIEAKLNLDPDDPTHDLNVYPHKIIPLQKNDKLIIGDLHGNALKMLNTLIRYDVLRMSKSDYKEFLDIYYESPAFMDAAKINKLHLILSRIEPGNVSVFLDLIGDLIADRGKNDCLTILLLEVVSNFGIKFEINHSNHDVELFQGWDKLGMQGIGLTTLGTGQDASMEGLNSLIVEGLVNIKDVKRILENVYKPALKLITYQISTDKKAIMINTHAGVVDLDVIEEFAKECGIPFNKKSIATLAESIDKVNGYFLKNFDEFVRLQFAYQYTEKEDRLIKLLRKFSHERDYTGLKRNERVNGYNVYYNHGHNEEEYYSVDNNWGKFSSGNKAKMSASGVLVRDGKTLQVKSAYPMTLGMIDEAQIKVLEDLFKLHRDPFNIIGNPLLAQENFKKIRDVSIYNVIQFILRYPQHADAILRRNFGADKMSGARNFRQEICTGTGDILRYLIIKSDEDVRAAIARNQLLASSHIEDKGLADEMVKLLEYRNQDMGKILEMYASKGDKAQERFKLYFRAWIGLDGDDKELRKYCVSVPSNVLALCGRLDAKSGDKRHPFTRKLRGIVASDAVCQIIIGNIKRAGLVPGNLTIILNLNQQQGGKTRSSLTGELAAKGESWGKYVVTPQVKQALFKSYADVPPNNDELVALIDGHKALGLAGDQYYMLVEACMQSVKTKQSSLQIVDRLTRSLTVYPKSLELLAAHLNKMPNNDRLRFMDDLFKVGVTNKDILMFIGQLITKHGLRLNKADDLTSGVASVLALHSVLDVMPKKLTQESFNKKIEIKFTSSEDANKRIDELNLFHQKYSDLLQVLDSIKDEYHTDELIQHIKATISCPDDVDLHKFIHSRMINLAEAISSFSDKLDEAEKLAQGKAKADVSKAATKSAVTKTEVAKPHYRFYDTEVENLRSAVKNFKEKFETDKFAKGTTTFIYRLGMFLAYWDRNQYQEAHQLFKGLKLPDQIINGSSKQEKDLYAAMVAISPTLSQQKRKSTQKQPQVSSSAAVGVPPSRAPEYMPTNVTEGRELIEIKKIFNRDDKERDEIVGGILIQASKAQIAEGYKFLNDYVNHYLKADDTAEQQKIYKAIYEGYLKAGSEDEVNLSSKLRKACAWLYDNFDANNAKNVLREVANEVARQILLRQTSDELKKAVPLFYAEHQAYDEEMRQLNKHEADKQDKKDVKAAAHKLKKDIKAGQSELGPAPKDIIDIDEVIESISKKTPHNDKISELVEILSDANSYAEILPEAKQKHYIESIEFLRDFGLFLEQPTQKLFQKIYNRYISSQGELPINIDAEAREPLDAIYAKFNTVGAIGALFLAASQTAQLISGDFTGNSQYPVFNKLHESKSMPVSESKTEGKPKKEAKLSLVGLFKQKKSTTEKTKKTKLKREGDDENSPPIPVK